MRRINLAIALLIAAAALGPAAHAQQRRGKRKPAPPPRATRLPNNAAAAESGRLENSVYTNDYFGLRLRVPEGWNVSDRAGVEQINERGVEAFSGGSQSRKEMLDRAAQKLISLITVGKLIPGEKGDTPAMLMIVAEPIPAWFVKTGRDYNGLVKRMMLSSGVKYEMEDAGAQTVGGLEFAVMNGSSEQPAGMVRQKFYSIVRRGHGLAIIWTYLTDQGEQEIAEVVKTIEFRSAP